VQTVSPAPTCVDRPITASNGMVYQLKCNRYLGTGSYVDLEGIESAEACLELCLGPYVARCVGIDFVPANNLCLVVFIIATTGDLQGWQSITVTGPA
jgi:hypothetical protein